MPSNLLQTDVYQLTLSEKEIDMTKTVDKTESNINIRKQRQMWDNSKKSLSILMSP